MASGKNKLDGLVPDGNDGHDYDCDYDCAFDFAYVGDWIRNDYDYDFDFADAGDWIRNDGDQDYAFDVDYSREEEFAITTSPIYPGNRKFPDCVNRRVEVPAAYFNQSGDDMYKGKCVKWGKYRSTSGGYLLGYYIRYDAGDAFWMLEKDVQTYLLDE